MKKLIVLIFIAGLLFAVKPVPRNEKTNNDNKSKTKVENVTKTKNNQTHDHFQDVDSNSINDQREKDFQNIKKLQSDFKDFLNIFNKEKPSNSDSPSKKKSK
jgi:hypothetical protein